MKKTVGCAKTFFS